MKSMIAKTTAKLGIAIAVAAVVMTAHVPASFAYGDAPWCAVVSLGTGEMHWGCYYRTVEECQPHVIAGNRGFCNLNPYGPGPYASAAVPHARYKKRHAH